MSFLSGADEDDISLPPPKKKKKDLKKKEVKKFQNIVNKIASETIYEETEEDQREEIVDDLMNMVSSFEVEEGKTESKPLSRSNDSKPNVVKEVKPKPKISQSLSKPTSIPKKEDNLEKSQGNDLLNQVKEKDAMIDTLRDALCEANEKIQMYKVEIETLKKQLSQKDSINQGTSATSQSSMIRRGRGTPPPPPARERPPPVPRRY